MQIQTREEKQTGLALLLSNESKRLEAMLPDFMQKQAARFMEVVLSASKNPQVAACSPASVVEAVVRAAQWGIVPDGTHGALVPFGQSCTFVPMYRGLIAAYRRSKDIRQVWAEVVFQGDEFEYEVGMEPKLRHVPKEKERTNAEKVVAAYACARWHDGHVDFVVMTKDELDFVKRKARSQNGPWKTDTVSMYLKCPIRRLSKVLPLAPELQELVVRDEMDEREPEEREVETLSSKPIKTMDDLKESLVPLEPETTPAAEEPNFAPRMVKGIPVQDSVEWDKIREVPFGGSDKLLATMTPGELAHAYNSNERVKAAADAKMKQAHAMYADGKEPPEPFQKVALALHMAESDGVF